MYYGSDRVGSVLEGGDLEDYTYLPTGNRSTIDVMMNWLKMNVMCHVRNGMDWNGKYMIHCGQLFTYLPR